MNNYHTHTFRCSHAFGSEEDMVKKAIAEGYETLGFSEHVPLPFLRWHLIRALPFAIRGFWSTLSWTKAFLFNGPGMRMPYKEKKEHLSTLYTLKKQYENEINIKIGFECEYLKEYLDYYRSMLESKEVDYLILGHHYRKFTVSKRYYARPNISIKEIEMYVKEAKIALKTGLFSYFAHPDLYMNGYLKWDEEVERLTEELCLAAKENHVPLELNGGGIRRQTVLINDRECYPYPNIFFWEVASRVGNDVIIGMDAHHPSHLNKEDYQKLEAFAAKLNLNLITTLD